MPISLRRAGADAWLLVVCCCAVLATFLLRAGHRRSVVVDYDDGVYWQTGLALASGHRPYSEVFFAQPPLFGWLLTLPLRLHTGDEFARIVMIGWAVGLAAAAGVLALTIGGRRSGLVAALLIALLPPVQRYCFQFSADPPAAALVAWALVAAIRARAGASTRWWMLSGVLLGAAVSVKLIAVVIAPALLVIAAGRRSALWMLAGAASACAAVLVLLRPPPAQAWRQVVLLHLTASNGPAQPVPAGAISMLVAWILPFGLLVSVGTVLLLRRGPAAARRSVAALVVWGIAGTVFVALYRPIFEHHLLLFVAPGASIIAAGAALLMSGMAGPRWTLGIAGLAVVCVLQALLLPVAPDRHVGTMLSCLRTLPRDALLLTDDQEIAAQAGLRTPPALADTSRVRIESGQLPAGAVIAAAQPARAALFAPAQRAKLVDPAVLAWAAGRFPVRYEADGYRLYVATPDQVAGCAAARP